jgi:hypothetical protein
MSSKERRFNMNIAIVCGLREAVIADFIRELKLTSDEIVTKHGYSWVKCTQKTMTVQIPFLSEKMVRNSVRKLESKGILKVAALDADKFDSTYAGK